MSHGPYLAHDPISLTLCADLSHQPSLAHPDTVWQLTIRPDHPVTLKTSFGLRAQSFSIFPVFMINKVGKRKMDEFLNAPQIKKLWPDHIQLSLSPSAECVVNYDLWASATDMLDGRVVMKNTSSATLDLGTRIAAQLVSFGAANGMKLTKRKNQNYLKGESDGLQISLIMDGMCKPVISPELALENSKLLRPGESLSIYWRCKVSEGSKPEDNRVFSLFPVNWDAEMARRELTQQTQEISITTPNVEWDIAFRMAQIQAQQLIGIPDLVNNEQIIRATRNIHSQAQSTLISSETQSNQASALAIWQLVQVMLAARPTVTAQLFETYLQSLAKPNPQPPKVELPFPILCQTGWSIHSYLQDQTFLERIYPHLRSQLFAWFWAQNDRDQDGLPEWASYQQTGLKNILVYDLLNPDHLVTNISMVETLGLGALLQKECQALNLMARLLEDRQTEKVLDTVRSKLEIRMNELRDSNILSRDMTSHSSHGEKVYFEGYPHDLPNEPIVVSQAGRLNLKIKPTVQLRKPAGLILRGLDKFGMPVAEELMPEDLKWLPGFFLYTSKTQFSQFVTISGGLPEDSHMCLYQADIRQADISQLLAWDLNKEVPALQELIDQWLTSEATPFRFGIPDDLSNPDQSPSDSYVDVAWNGLLIQHVLSLGERELAFRLFDQLMKGTISVLKQEHALFEGFMATTGKPGGKANDIHGLIPLALFFEMLGVKIYSPTRVSIGGANPVPWPVTIRYMGLEITRDQKNSTITMPDGSTYHHFGSSTKTYWMET